MKKNILFLILVLCSIFVKGQSTHATIENVDYFIEGDKIIVNYSIHNSVPDENFVIGLKFVSEESEIITPKTVTGDVGPGIKGGADKEIYWDVLNDISDFSGKYKAIVSITKINNERYNNLGGGPGYMFLSVIAPGWGDYMVKKDKRRRIPYWLLSIAGYGTLTYSAIARGMESIYQSEYDEAYYQSDIDSAYLMANTWHRRNVIANRVAMTIWIGDMSMVLIKGIRNKAIRRKYNLSSNSSPKHDYMIMYDPVTEGVRFTYVVKF